MQGQLKPAYALEPAPGMTQQLSQAKNARDASKAMQVRSLPAAFQACSLTSFRSQGYGSYLCQGTGLCPVPGAEPWLQLAGKKPLLGRSCGKLVSIRASRQAWG